MKISKIYIKIWSLTALTVALLLTGINYFIDPFRLFHEFPATTALSGFERQGKSWQVSMLTPEVVILGNSRNQFGFDIGLVQKEQSFNYSIPGADFSEIKRQFDHLMYVNQPRKLFVVVDEICTNGRPNPSLISATFTNEQEFINANVAHLRYLLSIKTLQKSIQSLLGKQNYDRYGRKINFDFGVANGRTISQRVNIKEKKRLKNVKNASPFCDSSQFEALLLQAYQSEVEVALIINPVHVRYIQISSQLEGHDDSLFSMKKQLVEINTAIASEQHQKPYPIYDFNLINEYTTEIFDMRNDTESIYWWESSHYKKALGDVMINWIATPKNARQSSIGVELNKSNINKNIASQLTHLQQWRITNRGIVNNLNTLIQSE
ncbi:MAG: hypothetical protein CL579_09705 [Alteromonadaceae bacterium]|nr:hypothetical protein [Alteromonadaceae bacterium]